MQSNHHGARGRTNSGRNSGIDLFRGVLVVLVILGHFSELTHRESFLTWLGLGFRMPLFIGLSGYLFNLEHARSVSATALFRKYYKRLILPWLTACIIVLTLTGKIDWLAPLTIFVQPPFHLWFVPVMLAFIFVARACRLDAATMLAIAIPGSIAAMYVLGVGHQAMPAGHGMPDRRYFIYPVYFALGMWVARRPFDPSLRTAALVMAGIGLAWWCCLYVQPSLSGEVAAEVLLCVPLIALFPWVRQWAVPVPPVAAIGRDSLIFYLWHPLIFALWTDWGAVGWPLLALSCLSILLLWHVIQRYPLLCVVLGARTATPIAEPAPAPANPADATRGSA